MAVAGNLFQASIAGGLETKLPQNPLNASRAENLTLDRRTGGWSTRVGYEKFKPGPATSFAPFASVGPVSSLHVAQELGGGARQHIMFEADGNLQLVYDASGSTILRTIASGRHIPTSTEAGSWYTDTVHGVVITNGVDRPILVKPWPLGDAAESASTIQQTVRNFGFAVAPRPVGIRPIVPMPVPPIASSPDTSGGATSLWALADSSAISAGGRWGMGIAQNNGTAPGSESLFGWSVANISTTGSEGPASELSSVTWQLQPNSAGFRMCAALEVPLGPPGTVARKLYRTANYSTDGGASGDTALYFVGLLRNNVETLFFDAVRTADLGAVSPAIPTGPLPAPRARFSALFNGRLFLDGGIDDSLTLFYSAQGLIEQFDAASKITLSGQGGGITALYANYTSLYVFRESGIDVVSLADNGTYRTSTISNSVTCRAPHSIQTVPGLGVVFLAQDGVYVLTGGLEGGAIADVIPITADLDGVIERMSEDCTPRAVGVYSHPRREYHLYFPVDGNDRPNLGLVLHTARLGLETRLSPWSTREGFPIGSLGVLFDGTIIFGHNLGAQAGGVDPEAGLFVLSAARSMGGSIVGDAYVPGPAPTSAYRSAWFAFGDPKSKVQVNYVTLWVLTTGQPILTVRHFKDFSDVPLQERSYRSQPPDAAALPVFDTAFLDQTAQWTNLQLVPVRVSVANMSCSWFNFEVLTDEDIVLVGFEYEYSSKGTRITAGVRV